MHVIFHSEEIYCIHLFRWSTKLEKILTYINLYIYLILLEICYDFRYNLYHRPNKNDNNKKDWIKHISLVWSNTWIKTIMEFSLKTVLLIPRAQGKETIWLKVWRLIELFKINRDWFLPGRKFLATYFWHPVKTALCLFENGRRNRHAWYLASRWIRS